MSPSLRKDARGDRIRRYECPSAKARRPCRERAHVLGKVVEPFVEARFFEIIRAFSRRDAQGDSDRCLLEDKVRVAERELVAFRDGSEILNTLGRDRYVQGLGVRSDAVDDALHALNSAAQRPDPSKVDFLVGAWASMPVQEKRKELRSAIDAVFLRSASGRQIQDRALVIPIGEGPDDLPRRGRRVPFAPFVWPPDSASSS